MTLREIHLPRFPECWETCGSCKQGETFILEVFVAPGDRVQYDDVLLALETGKVALDIQSPYDGTVREVFVREGDSATEGLLLATLET